MSLEQKIMGKMKEAMKSKNEATLRALRAIKAEIIKAKTERGAHGEINEEKEVSMLQKMMKQLARAEKEKSAQANRVTHGTPKALRKLKHPSRSDKLRSFIDTL